MCLLKHDNLPACSVKSEKYDIYVSKQLRMNDEYHLFNRVSIRPGNNFGFKSRAKRYLAGRVQYTAKGTSTFNLERDLLMCGDISENPGPGKTKSATKYPMWWMSESGQEQPRRHFVRLLSQMVTRQMPTNIVDNFPLLLRQTGPRLDLLYLCSATSELTPSLRALERNHRMRWKLIH